jgi:hypothetical protein
MGKVRNTTSARCGASYDAGSYFTPHILSGLPETKWDRRNVNQNRSRNGLSLITEKAVPKKDPRSKRLCKFDVVLGPLVAYLEHSYPLVTLLC